jgi:hypothetical protein
MKKQVENIKEQRANANIKKINRNILLAAVLSILILSVSFAAMSTSASSNPRLSDAYSKENINKLKDNPPVDNTPKQIGIMAVDQTTYTDMWLKSNTNIVSTSATSWTDMPGMSQTIITKYPADLLIMLSAESASTVNSRVIVRVLVDNNVALPGVIDLNSRIPNYQGSSFNFYKTNVPAGNHVIKIQWVSESPSPERAIVGYRTLSIIANGAGH